MLTFMPLIVMSPFFFIVIEASDPDFDPAKVKKLLEDAGGKHITLLEDAD